MKIWLLTHSEELKKSTGTGKLVKDTLSDDCEVIVWSRVLPNDELVSLSTKDTILVYPYDNELQQSTDTPELSDAKNIIILDGTWQQARKMYNQSPYLKVFQHKEITGLTSVYSKRRNQKNTGLCTAEVAIYILTEQKHPLLTQLIDSFSIFNQ